MHRAFAQSLQELWAVRKRQLRLRERHPGPGAMHLGPVLLLLLDGGLKEVIPGLGRNVVLLAKGTKIVGDMADNTGLFPRLAACCFGSRGFIGLPTTFGEDPAGSAVGGDQEDIVFVLGESNHTGDETFTLRAVP